MSLPATASLNSLGSVERSAGGRLTPPRRAAPARDAAITNPLVRHLAEGPDQWAPLAGAWSQ